MNLKILVFQFVAFILTDTKIVPFLTSGSSSVLAPEFFGMILVGFDSFLAFLCWDISASGSPSVI